MDWPLTNALMHDAQADRGVGLRVTSFVRVLNGSGKRRRLTRNSLMED